MCEIDLNSEKEENELYTKSIIRFIFEPRLASGTYSEHVSPIFASFKFVRCHVPTHFSDKPEFTRQSSLAR